MAVDDNINWDSRRTLAMKLSKDIQVSSESVNRLTTICDKLQEKKSRLKTVMDTLTELVSKEEQTLYKLKENLKLLKNEWEEIGNSLDIFFLDVDGAELEQTITHMENKPSEDRRKLKGIEKQYNANIQTEKETRKQIKINKIKYKVLQTRLEVECKSHIMINTIINDFTNDSNVSSFIEIGRCQLNLKFEETNNHNYQFRIKKKSNGKWCKFKYQRVNDTIPLTDSEIGKITTGLCKNQFNTSTFTNLKERQEIVLSKLLGEEVNGRTYETNSNREGN